MSFEKSFLLEFGPLQADCNARLLLRVGEVIPLPPKAFDVLRTLLQADGQTLTRENLMEPVWGDTFVEDANLTQAISVLRRALGDES
jgi:DNA-binding winged helix-turn-helix (wHTH) protein